MTAPQGSSRRLALRLGLGVVAVASWLAIAVIGDRAPETPGRTSVEGPADLLGLIAWFVVPAVLAGVAGGWRDPVAASIVWLGTVAGAGVVAWIAGVPDVLPDADPAMRAAYQTMVVGIAAAVAGVLGGAVVAVGYRVGRLVG